MKLTDGYYFNGFLIFGDPGKNCYASKGFEIQPPDLRNGSVASLHEFEDRLRRLLTSIRPPARTQWCWNVNSDYKDSLEAYDYYTDKMAVNEWSQRTRKERYHRYIKRMEAGRLRREKLRIYISIPIQTNGKKSPYQTEEDRNCFYDSCLKGLESFFETQFHLMQHIFGAGTRINIMGDEEHHAHHSEFFNPSFAYRRINRFFESFNPDKSILTNSFKSSIDGNERTPDKDYSFYFDGFYHNILIIKRWPQQTWQSMIFRLTGLRFLDYSLCVNIVPGEIKKEIRMEEKDIERLRGDYNSNGKESLLSAIEKKQQKIRSLTSGATYPLKVEYIIRIWARDLDELSVKTSAVKATLNLMESAQYWEGKLSTQSINLFTQTVPGWIFGQYDAHALYAESDYFAAMLPFSSTFTGHIEKAEALYDGDNFNLVGVRTFIGSTPQHGAFFGMSGAGKSAFMCDILSQTEPFYSYTVIIEKGLSYGVYTATMGAKPIIIHPDSDLTINYLDTHKLPLSPSQIANATALVSQMCGAADSAEQENMRYATIMSYIRQVYQDAYDNWLKSHKEKLHEITAFVIACLDYKTAKMPESSKLVDAYLEFKEFSLEKPAEFKAMIDGVTLEQIARFSKGLETVEIVRDFSFAWFEAEDFPTHSELQELMLASVNPVHDIEAVKRIATLLSAWNAGGAYGPLFDGHTNISLTGKIAHFELGYIAKATPELKKLAAFLITNYARNHVISLPRKTRKRYIFEEAESLLDMPGGEALISECYTQMRKFGCWVLSIVQQYAQFKHNRVRPAIMGNCKQFYIMKQVDRGDLSDLTDRDREGIDLPEVTQESIMTYPAPEHLPENDKYSSLTYFHIDRYMPLIGTCRNYCSPEMLYCSASSEDDFDKRMRELKSFDNPVTAIIEHCQKTAKEAS